MNQRFIQHQVRAARESFDGLLESLPTKPLNANQRKLAKSKAGTPAQFGRAVVNAIGEISVDEATAAIAAYLKKWNESA